MTYLVCQRVPWRLIFLQGKSPSGTSVGLWSTGHPRDTHTHTHTHTHTQTHTDTHRHTQTHTDTHRHTQTHTDTHRHTQTHTHTHTHTHTICQNFPQQKIQLGVSKNRGKTPKWMVYNGKIWKTLLKFMICGVFTPIFGNTQADFNSEFRGCFFVVSLSRQATIAFGL